jgi:hypothetical protein
MLSLLGCDLPQTLVPPLAGENEAGFWESSPVVRLNNDILESAGSTWHDWLPFNENWYSSPKRLSFDERGISILNEEFGVSQFFVLKDPRICRFAPFWIDLLASINVTARVVVPIRHPQEVAASLQARSGFDLEFGILLWLRHVLDAEYATRGQARHFTSYDLAMTNWAMMAQKMGEALDLAWPRWSEASASEIAGFLSPKLRHHVRTPTDFISDPLQPAWARKTFQILHNWTTNGEREEDFAELDRIRAELGGAAPAFGRLVTRGRQNAGKIRQLESNVGEARAKLDAAEKAKIESEGQKTSIAVELADLSTKFTMATEALARCQNELAETEKEREAIENGLTAQTQELLETRRNLDAVEKAKIESEGQKTSIAVELADLSTKFTMATEALARCQNELAEVEREREAIENGLTAQTQELLEARRKLDAAEGVRADLERLVADLEQATTSNRSELADVMSRLAQTESALAQRRAEIEETGQQLVEAHEQLSAAEAEKAKADAVVARLAEELETERHKTSGTFGEIVALTQMLREKEQEVDAISEDLRSTRETFTQQLLETETARRREAQDVHEATSTERALLNQQIEQLSMLAAQYHAREAENAALVQRLESERAEAIRAHENSETALKAVEALLMERDERFNTLSRTVAEYDSARQLSQNKVLWLREALAVLLDLDTGKPALLTRRLTALQHARRSARLKMLGLFDDDAYLAAHPDVAADGRDPLRHYILHGLEEGRARGIELGGTGHREAEYL